MGHSDSQQLEPATTSAEATLAKPLAPEDVRPGDFVAVLHEIAELPSFYWCADAGFHPRDELVRIRYIPSSEALPLKVKSVCLPFVLVKAPRGERRTLDLRKCRLARLDRAYASNAWQLYKKAIKKRSRGKSGRC
jgi:hypothetical protein